MISQIEFSRDLFLSETEDFLFIVNDCTKFIDNLSEAAIQYELVYVWHFVWIIFHTLVVLRSNNHVFVL